MTLNEVLCCQEANLLNTPRTDIDVSRYRIHLNMNYVSIQTSFTEHRYKDGIAEVIWFCDYSQNNNYNHV